MQPVINMYYTFQAFNATISMWLLLHVLSTRGTSNISLALKGTYVTAHCISGTLLSVYIIFHHDHTATNTNQQRTLE